MPSLKVEALLEKLEFAAGAERVETMDAQALAEEFLGDSIVSNILAMGYAWQRGLVPVGLAAMQRAIELNGVAVESNKAAFSLGRLAAADPKACRELLHEPDPASRHPETLDELIERSARFLTDYQDAAYAERYRRQIATVRAREEAVSGAGGRPAADARGGDAAAEAHGLQGRIRGRPPLHRRRVRDGASPSSSRASRRSSSTWRRRRW